MEFTFQFRTWMLLSVLRLSPNTWTDIFKDTGHRMPATQQEYNAVKDVLQWENVLQGQVFDLTRQADSKHRAKGAYLVDGNPPMPLFQRLGQPTTGGSFALPHYPFQMDSAIHPYQEESEILAYGDPLAADTDSGSDTDEGSVEPSNP